MTRHARARGPGRSGVALAGTMLVHGVAGVFLLAAGVLLWRAWMAGEVARDTGDAETVADSDGDQWDREERAALRRANPRARGPQRGEHPVLVTTPRCSGSLLPGARCHRSLGHET